MGKIGYQFSSSFFFQRKREPFVPIFRTCAVSALFPRRRSRSRNHKRTDLRSSENSVLIPLTTPSVYDQVKTGSSEWEELN